MCILTYGAENEKRNTHFKNQVKSFNIHSAKFLIGHLTF